MTIREPTNSYAVSTNAGVTFTLFDGWQEIGTVEPDGSSRAMLAVGEFRLAADTASGPMYVHAGLEGSVIALMLTTLLKAILIDDTR